MFGLNNCKPSDKNGIEVMIRQWRDLPAGKSPVFQSSYLWINEEHKKHFAITWPGHLWINDKSYVCANEVMPHALHIPFCLRRNYQLEVMREVMLLESSYCACFRQKTCFALSQLRFNHNNFVVAIHSADWQSPFSFIYIIVM